MNTFQDVSSNPEWRKSRARFLFRQQRERACEDDVQLTASQAHGVIAQSRYNELSDTRATAALAGTENFLHVEEDDFVISLRAFEGGIERARERGCISPAYTVMRPSAQVVPAFFYYLLKSSAFIQTLQTAVTGIRDGKSVRYEQFADLVLPTPDLPTQIRIADFLNRETGRIDELIGKKEQLVNLLRERRISAREKSLASEGQLAKLGHHISILPGYAFASAKFTDNPEDIRLLRGISVGVNEVRWNDAVYWPASSGADLQRFALAEGDLVMGMDRPWVSEGIRVARIQKEDLPCLLLQRVCKIMPRSTLDSRYLKALIESRTFLAYFEPILTGVSVPHISGDQIANFRFRFIERPEQERRMDSLASEMASIASMERLTTDSIDRLREYRAALITAAVTGQINVDTYGKAGKTSATLDRIEEEMQA